MRVKANEERVDVTDQDNDVTTSVAGANGFNAIWDLSPSTDVYYKILQQDHPQLGSQGNLRLRMQLPQEGGGSTEISDNARIRITAQSPLEDNEGTDVLGEVFRYRRFSQPDQFDDEDVVRLTLGENVKITEAGHLKVEVDNSDAGNDVDLSQSGGFLTLEAYRGVTR